MPAVIAPVASLLLFEAVLVAAMPDGVTAWRKEIRAPPHASELMVLDSYLSGQVLDIFIALMTRAGNSRYVLPSRYDADAPMSRATFNRVTYLVVDQAKKEGLPLEPFTVHDLRRTGSTLLDELGFNSEWIEKCLATKMAVPHVASTTRRNMKCSAGT